MEVSDKLHASAAFPPLHIHYALIIFYTIKVRFFTNFSEHSNSFTVMNKTRQSAMFYAQIYYRWKCS